MNITTRPLSSEEILILIEKNRQPWKSIYFLALYTGLRISDLMCLPWQNEPPVRSIVEKKTHKAKLIIWSELATKYWEHLYEFGEQRLFLYPFNDVSSYRKHLQTDCERFKIDRKAVSFHSFRKSHAVITYKKGGMLAAKLTMNHSSLDTTSRYIETALRFDQMTIYDELFSRNAGI